MKTIVIRFMRGIKWMFVFHGELCELLLETDFRVHGFGIKITINMIVMSSFDRYGGLSRW